MDPDRHLSIALLWPISLIFIGFYRFFAGYSRPVRRQTVVQFK
jgi:hypothetical protein